MSKSARQASYEALLSWLRDGHFVSESLKQWKEKEKPEDRDWNLAQEISYGTVRSWRILEDYHRHLDIKTKNREKALLFMAYYQIHMMDRLPPYAVVDETVGLAKKLFSSTTARFFNAVLRKCCESPINLPSGDSPQELAGRYSFPDAFVQELCAYYDVETVKKILSSSNAIPSTMIRDRLVKDVSAAYSIIEDSREIKNLMQGSRYYIQNVTPGKLIHHLAQKISQPPQDILDLCAAPGGKSILLHDLYPQAHLTANDISEKKMEKIRENFQRCGIEATLNCTLGQEFRSPHLFDLIVVDAPCSNSGVLAKCPEARWRLEQEGNLRDIQMQLLQHAYTLLRPGGELWYLTCSILPKENEELVRDAGFTAVDSLTFLPNEEGQDGGFACRVYRG